MKKHILLIDNNKSNLHIFMQALNELGAEVKCTYADSCTHGDKMLEYILPDAIFVNLDPNITDNLEFVRITKKKRRLRERPVVVYSSQMLFYNFLARGHGADICMPSLPAVEQLKKTLSDILLPGAGARPIH